MLERQGGSNVPSRQIVRKMASLWRLKRQNKEKGYVNGVYLSSEAMKHCLQWSTAQREPSFLEKEASTL